MDFLWLMIAIAFMIVEATTVTLFGSCFVIGSLAGYLADVAGLSTVAQIITFIVISLLAIVILRPILRRMLAKNEGQSKTNVDAVLQQTGIVQVEINNLHATGIIKVRGAEWTARSIDNTVISVGEEVIVEHIEGVKAIVSKKQ